MADLHDLSRARKLALPRLQWPIIWNGDERIHKPARIVAFRLSRAGRERTEVHLIGDNGNVASLSRATDCYPSNFAVARRWMRTWAEARGLDLEEMLKRPRVPRTPKAGIPESWLANADPTRAAKANLKCQSPRQECGFTGRCEYGDCSLVIGK